MSLVSHAHTGVFFLGLFGISSEHADFFPRSSILLALCSRLFNEGGIPQETAIKSTAGWVQLPVNIIDYSFFKKKKMFSLYSPDCFSRRRPLHLPDPFSSHRWPRRRKCQLQERQVSLSGYDQHLAEFLFIVHSQSFSSTPACRDISSWNVFSVFLYSWSGQKNSLTYFFISPLQSVFTDGSAPSLVFAHFPS